jgi:hypothetical protein
VVTLTETGTRSSIDAGVGGFRGGEPELAIAVAGRAAGMLVIMDRGFPGVALWKAYAQAEAHLLIRARSSVARRPVKILDDVTFVYGPGDNAVLTRAQFFRANLIHARLDHALLEGALLTDAHLTGADLTSAKLAGADLSGADLSGADLTDANLTDADLTNTRWPPDAVVPEGWRRDTGSGLLQRAEPNSGGMAAG